MKANGEINFLQERKKEVSTMGTKFNVGDKIRCINPIDNLKKDEIYIVEKYSTCFENEIYLEEFQGPSYFESRFEKVKTDSTFKVGDVVECVNNDCYLSLTIRKNYTVLEVHEHSDKFPYFMIKNDLGNISEYRSTRFKKVEKKNPPQNPFKVGDWAKSTNTGRFYRIDLVLNDTHCDITAVSDCTSNADLLTTRLYNQSIFTLIPCSLTEVLRSFINPVLKLATGQEYRILEEAMQKLNNLIPDPLPSKAVKELIVGGKMIDAIKLYRSENVGIGLYFAKRAVGAWKETYDAALNEVKNELIGE